jgi:multidrug resistance efflux pump
MMNRRAILGIGGGAVLIIAGVLGFRMYYNGQHFVSTDNALITGDMVQVSSTNPGRISSEQVDVGDVVKKDQPMATVDVPVTSNLGLALATGPTQGTQVPNQLTSPVNGVVVAKPANIGEMVLPGQPVLTVVDLGKLWVTANVDESQINRINIGQPAEVHVDMLGRAFKGQVMAITPASAATFSLLPQNNASGNYTKITQRVPVKIAMDYAGQTLFPGTSVEVKISVS